MEFLRSIVDVQLKANGRRFEHRGVVHKVHDQMIVGCHANMVAYHKDLDSIPLANAFTVPQPDAFMPWGMDPIPTVSIPDSPIVAKHKKWTAKSVGIGTLCNPLDLGRPRRNGSSNVAESASV